MAVEEKNITFKLNWQAVNSNMKSQQIELEEGVQVCFGVKNNLFHHVVYVVSKSRHPSALDISEVYCAACNFPDQRKQMTLVTAEGPTCVFSAEIVEWKSPLTLTFWVSLKVKDTMQDFSHQLIDSHLSNHLWTAAKRARFTDVEFHVGQPSKQKVFTAHRAILAARSTIFAGQFDKTCAPNTVTIEDIHHSVFKQFLRFLYTGHLKVASTTNMSELLTLADRYQVGALQSLCRNPVQEMNASELTSLIISLNNHSTTRADSFSYKQGGLRPMQTSPSSAGEVASSVGCLQDQLPIQHGQTRHSPNNQDRMNAMFASNDPRSANVNYSYSKANTSSGPMSFCLPNFGHSTGYASPSRAPSAGLSPSSDSNSPSSTPIGKLRPFEAGVNSSTPAEGAPQLKPPSRNASANAIVGRKAEDAIDSQVMSIKASVVANAVSQLRLLFDEMLGETSASSESSSSSGSSPRTVRPAMPSSGSQKKAFTFLPPRLNASSSGSPSLGPPAASGFAFPSVTKEGKFGKVPLKSPSVGLPWKPERISDGQPSSLIGSPSGNTSLINTSTLDGPLSLTDTPRRSVNESVEITSKPIEIKYRADMDNPRHEGGDSNNSLCSEMLRNVMMSNSSTNAMSIL